MTKSVAALLLGLSFALLACARPGQVAQKVVPDVEKEAVVKVARRVVAAEGYRVVAAEDPAKLTSDWLEQGHRERRVMISLQDAQGEPAGVLITTLVLLRRRTPGAMTEPLVDTRASSRLLAEIVDAVNSEEGRDR